MRFMIGVLALALVTPVTMDLMPIVTAQAQNEAPKTATCTLEVAKMTCGGCAAAVKMAALKVDDVKEAKVSYEEKRADITYDPAKTNPEAIAKAITDKSGFPASVPKKPNGHSGRNGNEGARFAHSAKE